MAGARQRCPACSDERVIVKGLRSPTGIGGPLTFLLAVLRRSVLGLSGGSSHGVIFPVRGGIKLLKGSRPMVSDLLKHLHYSEPITPIANRETGAASLGSGEI
jgi:hypothetical protein